MSEKQKTIKQKVKVSGVGLHTGKACTLTFVPAKEDFGIKFQRVDLENKPIIEADVDFVVHTNRGTNIAKNGVSIHTTEHVLAAISGAQIDNLLIKITACETPILDGSSIEFTNALKKAGIAGSTKIGKNCMIGGQCAMVGHITIADEVKIAGQSGVVASITEKGKIVQGPMAFDIKDFQRSYVIFKKLPEMLKKLTEIEKSFLLENKK